MSDAYLKLTGTSAADFQPRSADPEISDDPAEPAAWTGVAIASIVSLPLWFAIGTTAFILL